MKTSGKVLAGIDTRFAMWIGVLSILVVGGLIATYQILVRTETPVLEWGILLPGYMFCALTATGISLVNSILTVFNVDRFVPVIKRGIWISLIFIVPFGIFVIMDLGRPAHILNLYTFFNSTARMAWMGVFDFTFVIALALQLVILIKREYVPKWIQLLISIIVMIAAIGVQTNLGALFGGISAKPLWSNNLLPLNFFVLGVTLGLCFHILFMSAVNRYKNGTIPQVLQNLFLKDYRPLIIGLIIVNLVLIMTKLIPGLFSPDKSSHMILLIAGPYSLLFWGLTVVVGGVLPLVILLRRKTRNSLRWLIGASALAIVGVFYTLYSLLIAGQSIGSILSDSSVFYFPDVWEMLLVSGALSLGLLLYLFGEILLPLEPEEKPTWFIFLKRRLGTSEEKVT